MIENNIAFMGGMNGSDLKHAAYSATGPMLGNLWDAEYL